MIACETMAFIKSTKTNALFDQSKQAKHRIFRVKRHIIILQIVWNYLR